MIAASVIAEVQRLLAKGIWSFRDVARMTGVSHGTVARIAHGQLVAEEQRETPQDEEPGIVVGPLERCPGCGGRVVMPCRLCALRNRPVEAAPLAPDQETDEGDDPLSLRLNALHQARYEEVRRRRDAEQSRLPKTADPRIERAKP